MSPLSTSPLSKLLFVLLLPLIHAAPAPNSPMTEIVPRCSTGGTPSPPIVPTITVAFCKDPDNIGDCLIQDNLVAGACNNLPAEYNDVVSSLYNEGYPCTFYADPDCTGASYERAYPHMDLSMENFNDVISSYVCQEKPVEKC